MQHQVKSQQQRNLDKKTQRQSTTILKKKGEKERMKEIKKERKKERERNPEERTSEEDFKGQRSKEARIPPFPLAREIISCLQYLGWEIAEHANQKRTRKKKLNQSKNKMNRIKWKHRLSSKLRHIRRGMFPVYTRRHADRRRILGRISPVEGAVKFKGRNASKARLAYRQQEQDNKSSRIISHSSRNGPLGDGGTHHSRGFPYLHIGLRSS